MKNWQSEFLSRPSMPPFITERIFVTLFITAAVVSPPFVITYRDPVTSRFWQMFICFLMLRRGAQFCRCWCKKEEVEQRQNNLYFFFFFLTYHPTVTGHKMEFCYVHNEQEKVFEFTGSEETGWDGCFTAAGFFIWSRPKGKLFWFDATLFALV